MYKDCQANQTRLQSSRIVQHLEEKGEFTCETVLTSAQVTANNVTKCRQVKHQLKHE